MAYGFTRLRLFTMAAVHALAGCTVGPAYHGAAPPAPAALRASAFNHSPPGVVATAPAASSWWVALDDPELTALIDSALARSTDVHAARARLRQARAALREQRANAFPKSSASAAFVHADLPTSSINVGNIDVYDASVDATWEIDLFGGTRRAVEAASAAADSQQAELADVQVQTAAEVAQSYIDLRDRQQRLALVRESAELEQQTLTLTEQRRSRGVASELDVERIRTQVEETRTQTIPLEAQIMESLDQLAALTAHEPGTLDADLAGGLGAVRPLPTLPTTVAVGDPAAMLRRRPDIRAAERQLASQNAQIGEHEADWFPKLSLFGDLGFSSSDPGHLLRRDNFTWFGVPYLQWNALDFGRTKARVEQAKAGYEEAQAKYEGAVLEALRDADVALFRYGHQRDAVISLRRVEASAARTATLTQQRYRAGVSSALDWLDAERTRFSAQQDRISGESQLIKYYVALQKSLGLGWQAGRPQVNVLLTRP
jgi:NodT family efflux transporter outer membrane factor (OMF) lipoprotein